MITEYIGPAQIAAILVLVQRGLEELHSQRNTKHLLARGGHEEGRAYYPVVAVTHLGWIAALFLLISPQAPVSWPLVVLYLALQAARYWIIGTLGPYWTHRIITLPGEPLVARGPYRLLPHPNYAVTILETYLLPACFGAYALGLILGTVWAAVLAYKVHLEDAAIDARRAAGKP